VADFADAWKRAELVPGWLTEAQAARLWQSASTVEAAAMIVEIGSHQGRSTIVLALAASERGARVTAIDPFIEGRLFGGRSSQAKFERNVSDSGLSTTVDLIPRPSQQARIDWTGEIGLLFIDGKHDYWTVTDDLLWQQHVPVGGFVLIHDAFSSIGVTVAVLRHVLPSTRLRYVDRIGSLARFEVGRPSRRDRARIVGELPWWIRNILIKVALRIGRLFGGTTPDPY
jgi:predicted O-methyltransferase YrrM